MRTITVEDFLGDMGDALQLKLEMGEGGLRHPISTPKVLKPGLLLTNLLQKHGADGLHADQIVVFGGQEMEFIAVLPPEARQELFKSLFEARISCLVVSRSQEPPPQMVQMAKLERIPLLCTGLPSGDFIDAAESWLEKEFQPSICKHGEMVDVYGVGIFIFGKSGIGKSECALDLVMRGHRLAADDVVRIRRVGDEVFGGCSDMIQHHMEIRGLGIINIKDLFGAASVRDTKKIDLVIELVDWDANQEYDRLGIVDRQYNLLGVSVPFLTLPVRPGRNTTTIIEVAARNHLLKRQGVYSARDFQNRFQLFSDRAAPADPSAPPAPSRPPDE